MDIPDDPPSLISVPSESKRTSAASVFFFVLELTPSS